MIRVGSIVEVERTPNVGYVLCGRVNNIRYWRKLDSKGTDFLVQFAQDEITWYPKEKCHELQEGKYIEVAGLIGRK
jgi:hypothetical protein